MKRWPKSRKVCKNCGCDPSRRDYGSNGYCCRCSKLIQRLSKVKDWNREHPDASRHIPFGVTDEEFEIWRIEVIGQLETLLRWLRRREELYTGHVSGKDIEDQLGRILRRILPKADYPRDASVITHHFNKEHRSVIYKLLDEIEEQVPWEGLGRNKTVQYWKARESIRKH
jgi:hypothetical protein